MTKKEKKALIGRLEAARNGQGWCAFGARLGLNANTLYNLCARGREPRAGTVLLIEQRLGAVS